MKSWNYRPDPVLRTPAPSYSRGDLALTVRAASGLTDVVLHLRVMLVHQLQQPQLNLGLVQEGLFVLDDLDGHQFLGLMIIGFHHLQGQGMSQSEGKWEVREETEPGTTVFPPAKEVHQYHYQYY